MIQIPCLLIKQLRAVLRKSVVSGKAKLPVILQGSRDGLSIRAQNAQAGVEYHLPGRQDTDTISLDYSALEDFAGSTTAPVTLEAIGRVVRVSWTHGKVPQVKEYESAGLEQVTAPESPKNWAIQDARLLQALGDAAGATSDNAARYALTHLQLRGKEGKIVSTDGHQLLIQDGFKFPWSEDVLIPALSVFKTKHLAPEGENAIGRTRAHVWLRCGSWTLWLAIDGSSRFPNVDQVVPAVRGPVSSAQLSPSEASFLLETLPRLPAGEDTDKPVTLDLNGHLAIRAKGDKGPITEVALPDSLVRGPRTRVQVTRRHLVHALELGFREFTIVKEDSPIVCRDEHRTYTWMVLDAKGALEHSPDAILITPTGDELKVRSTPAKSRPARIAPTMIRAVNGPAHEEPVEEHPETAFERPIAHTPAAAIEEAEALKLALRDAYLKVGRLVASLKRQRKQSKLLTCTMTALRQLQHIA